VMGPMVEGIRKRKERMTLERLITPTPKLI
jgi:hypothetical protein